MKKIVSISFNSPITVAVEGETDKELLENAKISVIEQLKKQYPSVTYTINDEGALSFETALPGIIVEEKDGSLGIITAINKKTINVTRKGHINILGDPTLFKKSNATFEEARSKRQIHTLTNSDTNESSSFTLDWSEGDTGYLKTKDSIKEVVVGKKSGSKYKVYIINGEGRYYTVTEKQLNDFLKDNKEDWD